MHWTSRCGGYESEEKVKKFEGWTFLSAVIDDSGICRGICAMDLKTMEVRTFPADAVIFCTGGIGAIFGQSTNSVVCTGSAQSALFQQGVDYANGEFIQVHPTAIPGEDKMPPDERIGARRRRAHVGAEKRRVIRGLRKRFPKPNVFIFWKSGIPNTATWFRGTSPPARFTG